jgi:DNA-binding NtrC family response regulator
LNKHDLPTVVVADNDNDVTVLLIAAFKLAGFEAYSANNVQDCINKIKKERRLELTR